LFPGDCVYSPRGSIHGFKNNTDQPIRVFMNIAPAGFEQFFAEAAEEWAQAELDMNRINTISEKYGIHGVDANYGTNKF
jgi:oxalate decarboxylase/phosphoglucose isomerase-like protein (cupin superfamily)